MDLQNRKPATELIKRFVNNPIWDKLYGPLASDWQSIREASKAIEPSHNKGYTLNRGVQLCIRALKEHGILETKKLTRVYESTTKKGKPRKCPSTCDRYRLNAVKLWLDFFTENCYLTDQEKNYLESILCEPGVEHIIRHRNIRPLGALTVLLWQLAFIVNVPSEKIEVFLGEIGGKVATANLTASKVLDSKDSDEFVNALIKKIRENNPLAIEVSKKLLGAGFQISMSSQDIYEFMKYTPENVAHIFVQFWSNVKNDSRLSRHTYVMSRLKNHFVKVYKGAYGTAQNNKQDY